MKDQQQLDGSIIILETVVLKQIIIINSLNKKTGPGLVFVEGGTFTMGRVEADVMTEWNNVPRRVTVSSLHG